MTIPVDVASISWRLPWTGVASPQFEARLAREIGPGHVLHGRRVVSIGRRVDNDDVLFYLPEGPAVLAVVHLTWSDRTPEPDHRLPWTTLYSSVQEWIVEGLDRDAAEYGPVEGPA